MYTTTKAYTKGYVSIKEPWGMSGEMTRGGLSKKRKSMCKGTEA
jgi:hypothetical protein